jgi:hypothetical protein
VRGSDGDAAGALAAGAAMVAIDPDSADGHYQRALAFGALGHAAAATRAIPPPTRAGRDTSTSSATSPRAPRPPTRLDGDSRRRARHQVHVLMANVGSPSGQPAIIPEPMCTRRTGFRTRSRSAGRPAPLAR